MYYFVQIVCTIAQNLLLLFLCNIFFVSQKSKRGIRMVAFLTFCSISVFLSLYPTLSIIRTLFWIVGGTLLVSVIFKTSLLQAFFSSLSMVAISGLSDIAIMVLMSLFGFRNQEIIEEGNVRIYFIIISTLFSLFLIVLIQFIKGLTTEKKIGIVSAQVLLPVCPSLAVSSIFACLLATDISNKTDLKYSYLFVALGLLYTNIVTMFYTVWLQEQKEERHNLELANHHYAMQKAYYEELHSQQEQTRALWHDIKKYLHAAQIESAGGTALDQLQGMVDSITPVVDVNNRVVSVILNEYVQAAEEMDTRLSLDIQIPSQLPITSADLYILLGNTLDNSLDACAALPAELREVSIQLRLHNQMLYYRVVNPYADAHFQRSRSHFHGYGLKNVKAVVERYQGNIQTSQKDGVFVVAIMINF